MFPHSARLQCVLWRGLCCALDQAASHKCDAPGFLQMAARETGIGAVESYMHAGKLLALELLVTVLQNKSQDWGNVRTEVRAKPAQQGTISCAASGSWSQNLTVPKLQRSLLFLAPMQPSGLPWRMQACLFCISVTSPRLAAVLCSADINAGHACHAVLWPVQAAPLPCAAAKLRQSL